MKKREIRLKERFINLSNNAQDAVSLYIKCKKLHTRIDFLANRS